MTYNPIEAIASLRIGVVEFVSPNEIKVSLDLEAPDGIASNAGLPRAFPRINGYVLIPTECGYIVGQIEWIAVERASFPKRKGFQDYGLIDLPFPHRKMSLNPLGLLKNDGDENDLVFERGVQAFPSVGEPVLIPTDKQLKAIFESGKNKRVKIGTSPLAANADIHIDPDRLFGRHLAVLGNTGSGKSCSVAGLIQWSIESVKKDTKKPNSRFVILDPNGEYSKAFKNAKVFQVGSEENPLEVPMWFWNSSEWISFAQASPKVQAPLLRRALRSMRNEEYSVADGIDKIIKRFLGTVLTSLIYEKNRGAPWGNFPAPKNFAEKLQKWLESLNGFKGQLVHSDNRLDSIIDNLSNYLSPRKPQYSTQEAAYSDIQKLEDTLKATHQSFGGIPEELLPKDENAPIKFPGDVFVSYLEALAQESGSEQYIDFLLTRIRTILADSKMKAIVGDEISLTLEEWLTSYLGSDKTNNDEIDEEKQNESEDDGSISIIDLSLVPSEITHVITAVIARMIFEALQRYRKENRDSLPTVLVMEEAHTFVKKYKDDSENQATSTVCCQIFEKIAREGRKFGLGLVLSSQRPSELSPTVLSQCNTFLLHRISNDRDQELVHKLVPDNLRGLLRELPSLPSQNAILLGWASELPVLVRMNDLKKSHQPHSNDPDFWDVWTRNKDRKANWDDVSKNWEKGS